MKRQAYDSHMSSNMSSDSVPDTNPAVLESDTQPGSEARVQVKYLVNAIYCSTEGEGVNIGRSQIFVRFQGCNIGCLNCDTKYTWSFKGESLEHRDLINRVQSLSKKTRKKVKWVSLTGGDPLDPIHRDKLPGLIDELHSLGFRVSIEASGNIVDREIFKAVDFVNFDFKTPSTGVETPLENLEVLIQDLGSSKFQIKSVIQNEKDYDWVWRAYESLERGAGAQTVDDLNWCLTPSSYGHYQTPLKWLWELNQDTGGNFRVIVQSHKIAYPPSEKNV